jgi:hypothetical protein
MRNCDAEASAIASGDRQVLSVKIPKNEPTTARLNCVLANEKFLTVEIPRYVLERLMVQAKRAIEDAPLLSLGVPTCSGLSWECVGQEIGRSATNC